MGGLIGWWAKLDFSTKFHPNRAKIGSLVFALVLGGWSGFSVVPARTYTIANPKLDFPHQIASLKGKVRLLGGLNMGQLHYMSLFQFYPHIG